MSRLQRRQRLSALLKSRVLTLALLILALGVSLAVGREVARQLSVKRELVRLKKGILEAERSTQELQTLIASLRSPTFQEGAARTRLNLQKSGEKVLVIPDLVPSSQPTNQSDSPSATPTQERTEKNSQRWWKFLFGPPAS